VRVIKQQDIGMDSTIIEKAKDEELPQVLALLEKSGLPEAGLEDHVETLLVVRQAGRVVGSAGLEMYGGVALLRSVATAPNLRGQGLGRNLTLAALDLAQENGVNKAYLLTETTEKFFRRFGFVPIERSVVPAAVKTSVEFTGACPDTAVAMELSLPPAPA
jgi:amino-acid N-acetyltransferase